MEQKLLFVAGTRPEVIKLAPVYHAACKELPRIRSIWLSTGQHREISQAALNAFEIVPDIDLDVMQPNQSLPDLASTVMKRFNAILDEINPGMVVVQGDTTTAMTAAVCSYYRKVAVAHVEAGLRSFDLDHPYPEEANRRLISIVARLHFAPTRRAADNLISEGLEADKVRITGNTVIDALLRLPPRVTASTQPLVPRLRAGQRLILVTSHRREAWGSELSGICRALARLRDDFADTVIVYPVHPNPNVRATVMTLLGNQERIHLVDPLDYFDFVELMRAAYLILTDSGGVQEEAPTFRVPVLVLRRVTERPEAVEQGSTRLVGTDTETIVREASALLRDRQAYSRMQELPNPFGDGRASERIVESIGEFLGAVPDHADTFDRMAP